MHLEIAYKWVWLLLPLPFLFYALLPPLRRRRTSLIAPFFQRAVRVSGAISRRNAWITRKNVWMYSVLILCWICLLAAASSPRYVNKPGKRPKTVRSFLIAADISFSMAETDWVVDGKRMSRWEAVKSLMKQFVENRKSDQIALVVFGSNAYIQAPLTTDLPMINWLMDQTEVGMAGQMTNIGDAIAYSVKILKEDTLKQKAMLLITDGVDTGTDLLPLDAAGMAAKDSITIYTLGIGKASGSGGYDLDEPTLKAIAHTTSGKYFNALDEKGLSGVYKALDALTPVEYQEESYEPVTLLYYYPLAVGVILALVFQLISGTLHLTRKMPAHA
ncbi:VWA domain-containing protein [Chitinophaga arvensicola]|uniref:Ca-activated chloride channel family protein n=1 Tax=Chitinophaga arvensicola TaxID=29529 RepID=A0A1I0RQQ5_9BACT|nr:VWA domain-containing protein [Chitinophaga arvensicola]SEW43656.1 Ca-activated chloride channel family protein [Chitinophaga arvensicola]